MWKAQLVYAKPSNRWLLRRLLATIFACDMHRRPRPSAVCSAGTPAAERGGSDAGWHKTSAPTFAHPAAVISASLRIPKAAGLDWTCGESGNDAPGGQVTVCATTSTKRTPMRLSQRLQRPNRRSRPGNCL